MAGVPLPLPQELVDSIIDLRATEMENVTDPALLQQVQKETFELRHACKKFDNAFVRRVFTTRTARVVLSPVLRRASKMLQDLCGLVKKCAAVKHVRLGLPRPVPDVYGSYALHKWSHAILKGLGPEMLRAMAAQAGRDIEIEMAGIEGFLLV